MNEDKDDDEKIKNSNSFTKPKSFLKSSNPKQQNQTSPTKLAATLESEEFENDLKENNNQNRTNRDSLSNKYSDDFDDENNKDNNLPKLSLDNNSTNSSTLLSSKHQFCLFKTIYLSIFKIFFYLKFRF